VFIHYIYYLIVEFNILKGIMSHGMRSKRS